MSTCDLPEVIHHATSLLCRHTGSMASMQLYREIIQNLQDGFTLDDFWYILNNCPRFVVVDTPGSERDSVIVAKTSLRLCKKYLQDNCSNCQELHLCKFHVYGNCRFGNDRNPCRFSHNIRSRHNQALLGECTLQGLPEDHLFLLLLQNDPSLLPEVCVHYNKGEVPHGACTFQVRCTKVHLCLHFVQGRCVFRSRCQRLHTLDQRGQQLLKARGLVDGDIIAKLPVLYQNRHLLATAPQASAGTGAPQGDGPLDLRHLIPPVTQNDERTSNADICLHFLRNTCRFEEKCVSVHFNRPYKWEVLKRRAWCDLQPMEEIEMAFCDPCNSKSLGVPPVDFVTMTRAGRPVRRLSTVSSVLKPAHYSLTTEWRWFYKESRGSWVEYGQADSRQRTTSVTSRDLEKQYQQDPSARVKIMKGFREYTVCFKVMYQRNLSQNTRRKVCRRPCFLGVGRLMSQ